MKRTISEIIEASNTTHSATAAAAKLNIKYSTYKKYAESLGVGKLINQEKVFQNL